MFKLDLEKAEDRDQIANIWWIIRKATEFQKNICFCFIDYAKAFDCVDHNKLQKILKLVYQIIWPASWEICMQVKKQQLELDIEQHTGSKSGREYVKALYYQHPCFVWHYACSVSSDWLVDMVHCYKCITQCMLNCSK